ncbi:unnamed protein product, partial [Nippostrongylus brasiliensis]|uniref:Nonstructural protein NS5 n=1 Tax=Nippostrongylus brasiliensis TaxID=27835 RepID=A0A0N4Y6R7_NIPBR
AQSRYSRLVTTGSESTDEQRILVTDSVSAPRLSSSGTSSLETSRRRTTRETGFALEGLDSLCRLTRLYSLAESTTEAESSEVISGSSEESR